MKGLKGTGKEHEGIVRSVKGHVGKKTGKGHEGIVGDKEGFENDCICSNPKRLSSCTKLYPLNLKTCIYTVYKVNIHLSK